MKRAIYSCAAMAFVLALVIGCQTSPKAEDIFAEAKALQEEADYTEAVASYSKLVEKYPDSEYAPQAQFLVGFIYANELEDLEKAKLAYEVFLTNYAEKSDSNMVASAQWELDNLGKNVDEIEDLTQVPEEGEEAEVEETVEAAE